MRKTFFALLLLLMGGVIFITSQRNTLVYTIGNSMTWDTIPSLLDGSSEGKVHWHVDCGKNLIYIFKNSENPCIKSSTIWTEAMKNNQYDFVVVQPYGNFDNLEQEVNVISQWMEMQPNATFIIHTGWSRHKEHEKAYHNGQRSPEYFSTIKTKLNSLHPGRSITTTKAVDILDLIYHDIENGNAPFEQFSDLYRDELHMTLTAGRYLMHNVMRTALNQPLSDQGFSDVDVPPELKNYLNQKIISVSEN